MKLLEPRSSTFDLLVWIRKTRQSLLVRSLNEVARVMNRSVGVVQSYHGALLPMSCQAFNGMTESQPACAFFLRLDISVIARIHADWLINFAWKGELFGPPSHLFHSFTNSFQSAMSCALRMSAVTGNSFGTRGTLSSFKPASCGRRLPLRAFTVLSDHTRFPHSSLPPRERGRTWSILPSSGRSNLPVYWQRLPSRSRIDFAQSFGRFFGTLAKFSATITVGTRIAPRTVCTAWSPSRIGSVIHSAQVTGRMWFSPSISRPVATFVAIWQNASCGVRMFIACQLRLSTSTIDLFRIPLLNFGHTVTVLCPLGCFFFVELRFSGI